MYGTILHHIIILQGAAAIVGKFTLAQKRTAQ
jgi:hypothetical protein